MYNKLLTLACRTCSTLLIQILFNSKNKEFNENKILKNRVIYIFFEKIFAKCKIWKLFSEKITKSTYQLTN